MIVARASAGSSRGSLATLSLLFAFAIVNAILIGASQWVLLTGLLIVGAVVFLLFVSGRGMEDKQGWILVIGWCAMLFIPVLRHLSGVPAGYVLELLVFGLALAGVRQVWAIASNDRVLRLLLGLLALHFVFALLSTALGRSRPLAALWQFQYNLKWPLMFAIGMLVVWNDRVDRVVRAMLRYSLIVILPVVIVEIVMPDAYTNVFGASTSSSLNPIIGAAVRYRGPFGHPGYLAIVSALLATAAMAQIVAGRSRWWGVLAIVYGGLVLLTGQRQELLALGACFLLFLAFCVRPHLILFGLAMGIVSVVIAAAYIYLEYLPLRTTLIRWGVIDDVIPYSERAILTMKGLAVAQQYFPLGSGLGTYGGAGAQKFDLSLFQDLGFGRYWWFMQGKFLVDTYWPNVAAESGLFGAAFLLAFFATMWIALLVRTWRLLGNAQIGFVFLGLCALTLLLLNSPSSQILTDPRGAIVLWTIIGASWRLTNANSERVADA
jgi:hypothetical protein